MKNPLLLIVTILLMAGIPKGRAQELSFAFLTDLHVSPGAESDKKLHEIVGEINRTSLDLAVVTGDLTNTGSNAELMAVKQALDNLEIPLLIVPGNHETNWSESAGLKFNELWDSDRFVYEKNGFLLLGLNTGPYMKMGNGHVKEEDIQWLSRVLKEKMNDEKTLISFAHYPLADGLDNWYNVTDILKSYHCRIDFCGHGHRLALFNFDGIPGVMGRPMDLRKGNGFGYNIVKIKGDSVVVYEKILGKGVGSPYVSLNYYSPDTLSQIPVCPRPDYSINNDFSNVNTMFSLNDTASIFAGPCLSGDTILLYGNSLGWLKAINIQSKETLWSEKFNGPIYSTPVIAGDKGVLGTTDGFIKGIDLLSGKEEWSIDVGRPVLAEGLAEGNFIYIGGGDKGFYKIDATDGKIIWIFSQIKGLVQGKPAVLGERVVFGAWDRHLYCLDKQTGKLLWKWNNGKSQVLFSPGNIVPVIAQEKVFLVAPDRYMTALDLQTGEEVWRNSSHMVRESIGVSPDGKQVYAKLMNDSIVAVPTSDREFKTNWIIDAGIGYDHNPCPVLGTERMVIGATRNGLIVSIDPKTREVLWKFKAGNSSVNKMIFQSPNTIWFTMIEGNIMALESLL